jgi:hypothetical protein
MYFLVVGQSVSKAIKIPWQDQVPLVEIS